MSYLNATVSREERINMKETKELKKQDLKSQIKNLDDNCGHTQSYV